MPRERIYTQDYEQTPNGSTPVDPTFSVEVAWTRDYGYVEVATTAVEGTERIVGIVNEWLRAAGYDQIDLAELRKKLADDLPPDFDGYHAHLTTRTDVNRLIRVLRRARDGSFGRDE